MLKRIVTLFLLSLVLVQPIQAVFIHASHLSDGKKNIYFFNDVHDANDKAPMQQIHVVSFAKKLNATILTEEMTDMNTLRRYIYDQNLLSQIELDCMELLQKEESQQFPLRGLSLFARSAGIDARNIDYRQWVDAFRTGQAITGRMAMHILDSVIDEIKHYDDNPVLNAYYKQCVDMVNDVFKPLWDYLRYNDVMVADLATTDEFNKIITHIQQDPRKTELHYNNYWIAFDSTLFDCILLHELTNSKDEQIIVCAGAQHCNKTSELLQQIGYTKSFERGQATGSTVPMVMNAFTNRILKDRSAVCMDESTRLDLVDKAIQSTLMRNTSGIHLPLTQAGMVHVMLMLFICLCAMGCIYVLMQRVYKRFVA